ncbi:MAG: DUF3231 family protein [Desulfosporosinus sp.]|nr:DUF3231 family protein [Desulfosporosinus sp.]
MQTQQDNQPQVGTIPNPVKSFPYDERLSSMEMSQLWLLYLAYDANKYCYNYYYAKTQDPEMKSLFVDALNNVQPQLDAISNLFNTVRFPIPHGFKDKDVNINAKRLFSDGLMLMHLRKQTKFGLIEFGHALSLVTRPDVKEFINSGLIQQQNLLNKIDEVLEKKGIYIKPPYTIVPDRVSYVKDKGDFYGGLFGKNRPINILELSYMFENLMIKDIAHALLLGFSQVAEDVEVKKCFQKGIEVVRKIRERGSKYLKEENLTLPVTLDSEVTDSKEAPFSDRLMVFDKLRVVNLSVIAIGFAMASSSRKDIIVSYYDDMREVQNYGKMLLDLYLEKGWMEGIPLVADRDEIIGLSH